MKKTGSISDIDITQIFANPDQPRKEFDQDKLEELAMSIKEYGVLEPIVVTPRANRLMIIAGERRYRASLLAGMTVIPARIIEANDHLVEELALLENIQRQDLNIIEEGQAYQRLLDRGWSVETLAKKLGYKKTGPIYDRLSLLNLTPEYQREVIQSNLTPLQAYEISRLSPDKQVMVYGKIKRGELNTYNKLYAFVTGIIALENQQEIFALTPLSEEEKVSISAFSCLLGVIEKFIGKVQGENRIRHLEKASLHGDISAQRLDLIITHLQKIRRTILVGEGVKDAQKEAA